MLRNFHRVVVNILCDLRQQLYMALNYRILSEMLMLLSPSPPPLLSASGDATCPNLGSLSLRKGPSQELKPHPTTTSKLAMVLHK